MRTRKQVIAHGERGVVERELHGEHVIFVDEGEHIAGDAHAIFRGGQKHHGQAFIVVGDLREDVGFIARTTHDLERNVHALPFLRSPLRTA